MSTTFGEDLFDIGARLKRERERLGFTQETLGTRLGTTGRTIKKYESNETSIRATELLQLSDIGGDVLYIVTGEKLPLGTAQVRAAYSATERLAEFIAGLKLSDEDVSLLRAMAARLAL